MENKNRMSVMKYFIASLSFVLITFMPNASLGNSISKEIGNRHIGEQCSTDNNCHSLCCSSGICKVHIITEIDIVLCAKKTGESCISDEFCNPTCRTKYKLFKFSDKTCSYMPVIESVFSICEKNICSRPEESEVRPRDPSMASDECITAPSISIYDPGNCNY